MADVVEVVPVEVAVVVVGDSEGKEEAENLRAVVNMDVELRDVVEGMEVMKEPRSPLEQRPERTGHIYQLSGLCSRVGILARRGHDRQLTS